MLIKIIVSFWQTNNHNLINHTSYPAEALSNLYLPTMAYSLGYITAQFYKIIAFGTATILNHFPSLDLRICTVPCLNETSRKGGREPLDHVQNSAIGFQVQVIGIIWLFWHVCVHLCILTGSNWQMGIDYSINEYCLRYRSTYP